MSGEWRVIDTGLRHAAENIALNRALLEARQQGIIPNTLRFLRFEPAALVGYHQAVEQELRTDYCSAEGIEIQRRITGGGAIYFDPTQIGWELYLDRRALGTSDMERIAGRVCEAAAEGIRRLGVDARFRPRNDIEVNGRKISGTGGAYDGNAILYQGTLLIDFDVERMLRVLRIPAEKLSDKAIAHARDRVVNLRELLGRAPELETVKSCMADSFAEAFGIALREGRLGAEEEALFAEALAEIDTHEWVHQPDRPVTASSMTQSIHRCAGGLIRVSVALDRGRGRIKQVWLTGDFFVNPKRLVLDLEAALKDTAVADLEHTVRRFFAGAEYEALLLSPGDFVAAIGSAVREDGGR